MKAAFIEHFGGPEVLKYGDLPDPVAGPGEVVIDVVAASVNKCRRRPSTKRDAPCQGQARVPGALKRF